MTLAVRTPAPEDRPRPPLFTKPAGAQPAAHAGSGNVIHTDNPRLSYVNPSFIEKMNARLRAQTAECVMATFGISVNTWLKMRKGMPIRKSVAERLVRRMSADL